MNIEPLESRIAPASVFNYIDVDGDKVKITSSAGTLDDGNVYLFPAGSGFGCGGLDLVAAFAGANIIFTVTKVPGGDGLANVNYIDAAGIDLGNVTIKGDLASIYCGNGNDADGPALKTLNVRSMGRFGEATGGGFGSLESDIQGKVNALVVAGDVKDVFFHTTSGIGAVTIKGSLVGGPATDNGRIVVGGGLGKLTIGKNIVGGSGTRAGSVEGLMGIGNASVGGSVIGGAGLRAGVIASDGDLGSVKIGKSLVGGTGESSGAILGGDNDRTGNVTIGGSIAGGAGRFSGGVFGGSPVSGTTSASLGVVTVGGSVFGSFGERSGAIFSFGALGGVKIGRDLIGSSGEQSGSIETYGRVGKSVSIGGSIVGGSGFFSGSIDTDFRDIGGSITIGGSLVGGSADATGYIDTGNVGGVVMVRGSVIGPSVNPNGGSVNTSGKIEVGNTKAITVLGDIVGGSISGSADMAGVGVLRALNVGAIVIGGSIIAGIDTSSGGDIERESGAIIVNSAGSITVKGSMVGNETCRAFIFVPGPSASTPGFALGKLTVGGNVQHSVIEVATITGRNGAVGAVKVAGDWIASSLASGISRGNALYGDGDDALLAGAISRIASITIGGAVIGTEVGGDSFAFTAHEIGSFKGAGRTIALTPNTIDGIRFFSAETGSDVTLREL